MHGRAATLAVKVVSARGLPDYCRTGIPPQFPGGGRGPVGMSDFGGRRGPPRWSARLGPGLRRGTGVGGFGFDAWPGGNAAGEGRVSARAAGLVSDGNYTSVPRRRPGPSRHVGFWRMPGGRHDGSPDWAPAFAGELGRVCAALTHDRAAMLARNVASAQNPPGLLSDGKQATVPRRRPRVRPSDVGRSRRPPRQCSQPGYGPCSETGKRQRSTSRTRHGTLAAWMARSDRSPMPLPPSRCWGVSPA